MTLQTFPISSVGKLSPREIIAAGEDAALQTFCKLRWPDSDGRAVCPRCGGLGAYRIQGRGFECADCAKQFTATTGTVFRYHKQSLVELLAAISLVVNDVHGDNCVRLARAIGCEWNTARKTYLKVKRCLAVESFAKRLGNPYPLALPAPPRLLALPPPDWMRAVPAKLPWAYPEIIEIGGIKITSGRKRYGPAEILWLDEDADQFTLESRGIYCAIHLDLRCYQFRSPVTLVPAPYYVEMLSEGDCLEIGSLWGEFEETARAYAVRVNQ